MSIPPKLEYELEILTLTKNIEKFKHAGLHTENLESRLDFCRAQFDALVLAEANRCIENNSNN